MRRPSNEMLAGWPDVAEHDGEIEVPREQPRQQHVRLCLDDLELESVIAACGPQCVGDEARGRCRERTDADQAAAKVGSCDEVGARSLLGEQQLLDMSQEESSRRRRADASRRAFEQGHAVGSFQCRDALRHRGRRVRQGLRGAAERPAPPNLSHDDQRLQIEHEARLTGSTKQSELVLTD